LAANLISESGFEGSEKQLNALDEGLGLQTPGETWTMIGTETAVLNPEEKVDLLTFIVPRFGEVSDDIMSDFAAGIRPTKEVLMEKGLAEADACLVGTELLARDFLGSEDVEKEDFGRWITEMSREEAEGILAARKSFKSKSEEELNRFVTEREERLKKEQEEREQMMKQVEKAREERTMFFNDETGKMEFIDGKDDE
jgi:hypothetical protein